MFEFLIGLVTLVTVLVIVALAFFGVGTLFATGFLIVDRFRFDADGLTTAQYAGKVSKIFAAGMLAFGLVVGLTAIVGPLAR